MDGIPSRQHLSDTAALEDSNVCVIPYAEIENMSRISPVFLNHEAVAEHNSAAHT